jgi:hypothetical protein
VEGCWISIAPNVLKKSSCFERKRETGKSKAGYEALDFQHSSSTYPSDIVGYYLRPLHWVLKGIPAVGAVDMLAADMPGALHLAREATRPVGIQQDCRASCSL